MARGETRPSAQGNILDNIDLMRGQREVILRPGTVNYALNSLTQQARQQKSRKDLNGQVQPFVSEQDQKNNNGKKSITQVGIIDEELIQPVTMIRTEIKKTVGPGCKKYVAGDRHEKQNNSRKKTTVLKKYAPDFFHNDRLDMGDMAQM